jgi:hypothetical protein
LHWLTTLLDERATLLTDYLADDAAVRDVGRAVRSRLLDTRVAVRRCALRLLAALMQPPFVADDLAAMRCLLADDSITVGFALRQSSSCAFELFHYYYYYRFERRRSMP